MAQNVLSETGGFIQKGKVEWHVEWKIKNFIVDNSSAAIPEVFSPKFALPGSEWFLGMYEIGGMIGIHLYKVKDLTTTKKVDSITLSLLNSRGDVVVSKSMNNLVFGNEGGPPFSRHGITHRYRGKSSRLESCTVVCTLKVNVTSYESSDM